MATNDGNARTSTERALVRKLVEDRDGYPAHLAFAYRECGEEEGSFAYLRRREEDS